MDLPHVHAEHGLRGVRLEADGAEAVLGAVHVPEVVPQHGLRVGLVGAQRALLVPRPPSTVLRFHMLLQDVPERETRVKSAKSDILSPSKLSKKAIKKCEKVPITVKMFNHHTRNQDLLIIQFIIPKEDINFGPKTKLSQDCELT